MNPYHKLFDDPDDLNAREHVGECNSGMGVPWTRDNPGLLMTLGTDDRLNERRPKGWWRRDQ